jgi:hypothetical protein
VNGTLQRIVSGVLGEVCMTWLDLMHEIDERFCKNQFPGFQTARLKLDNGDGTATVYAVRLIKDFDGEWLLVLDKNAPDNPVDHQ